MGFGGGENLGVSGWLRMKEMGMVGGVVVVLVFIFWRVLVLDVVEENGYKRGREVERIGGCVGEGLC